MKSRIDVLFINPGGAFKKYQELSVNYSAIEPPTWALLLASSCRSIGYKVGILDVNAKNLSNDEVLKKIEDYNPRLICFVVYGQNVNAGITNMVGATELSSFIKEKIKIPICYIGSYVQALPIKALKDEPSIDFVFTNEGVYALRNILSLKEIDIDNLGNINGIAWRKNGEPVINDPEKVVPNDRMDIDLPGYAWDLLPFKEKPLDLYRSPLWHAEYDEEKRTPYAAIQTSLGCQFKCSFCMINIINRDNRDEIGVASNYNKMRFWSTDFIIDEFDKLLKMGVKTIRIVDEMFLLNKKYYIPLCEKLAERNRNDDLILWSYSRIDTIADFDILKLIRRAGIKWLCLGIESANKKIRLEVAKGKFEDVDIVRVIDQVHNAGIEVMANYMYGLPGETKSDIEKTFNLSLELCTSGWNTYATMAFPGSQLYKECVENKKEVPINYNEFSFHSYETIPMNTEHLTNAEILKLRDDNYFKYHTNSVFLARIKDKFGEKAVENILMMSKITLKRRILGD